MFKQLMPALRMTIFLTVLTGLIYPAVVTGLCQAMFKHQADGSLIQKNGRIVGSSLIGQNFSRPEYFHPRPSAAGTDGYDGTASGGSNFGPTSQKLYYRVKGSVAQFHKENPTFRGPVPADAVTASGSGLDPEISVENAMAQSARVAKARGANDARVNDLVASVAKQRDLGFLGEARVNVLQLNLLLDERLQKR